MSKSKNVLVLLPGGSDPQKVEKYKEHFAELIRLSKEEYGFAHGEVLSLPGHESYKPKNYWNIAKAAEVLKDKIDELAKEYDTITINARCGGCYVVLEYLKQGAINSKIKSIRLWDPASLKKIEEVLLTDYPKDNDTPPTNIKGMYFDKESGLWFYREEGLCFNWDSIKSYNNLNFPDYMDHINKEKLPNGLNVKIGFGGQDKYAEENDIKLLKDKVNELNYISVHELPQYGHLVPFDPNLDKKEQFPDDFIKFCFE